MTATADRTAPAPAVPAVGTQVLIEQARRDPAVLSRLAAKAQAEEKARAEEAATRARAGLSLDQARQLIGMVESVRLDARQRIGSVLARIGREMGELLAWLDGRAVYHFFGEALCDEHPERLSVADLAQRLKVLVDLDKELTYLLYQFRFNRD